MPVIGVPAASVAAPAQYKQASRHGKKAWRKNVDITDVQEGLADAREDALHGGPVSELASEKLFTIDTAGSEAIRTTLGRTRKPLKVDEILARRSAVPALSSHKRAAETSGSATASKRQRTAYVSHKELQRLRRVADGKHEAASVEVVAATYDPWDDAPARASEEQRSAKFPFLDRVQPVQAPVTLKEAPVSLLVSGKQVRAVAKPGGGHSYNPIYTDYEERLVEAGSKELEAARKQRADEEQERIRAAAVAISAQQAEEAERKAELSEWDEDSAWEGFESGAEARETSKKRPERKTKAQRNKIARRKEEERRLLSKRNDKRKEEQVMAAKKLAREVAEKQARARALAPVPTTDSSASEDEDKLELRRRQLGKIKLPERDLELVLPDELQDSLRLLKPEGNLLKDRYRSMLVRGVIENRRPVIFAKKKRVRATEKWAHKDFMLH